MIIGEFARNMIEVWNLFNFTSYIVTGLLQHKNRVSDNRGNCILRSKIAVFDKNTVSKLFIICLLDYFFSGFSIISYSRRVLIGD